VSSRYVNQTSRYGAGGPPGTHIGTAGHARTADQDRSFASSRTVRQSDRAAVGPCGSRTVRQSDRAGAEPVRQWTRAAAGPGGSRIPAVALRTAARSAHALAHALATPNDADRAHSGIYSGPLQKISLADIGSSLVRRVMRRRRHLTLRANSNRIRDSQLTN
jgi:hypothetical protein